MESNHLTTRTYTAPTCTLIVSSKEVRSVRTQAQQPQPVDFILELERSDLGEIDRVTLQGQPSQLDSLQQTLDRYITALVAKFPHPIAQTHTETPVDAIQLDAAEVPPQPLRDPRVDNESSSRAGILKNLPGLRDSFPPLPPPIAADSPSDGDEKPSISRLLGRWNKPQQRPQSGSIDSTSATGKGARDNESTPAGESKATKPYLTGVGERSLEHQLHLGDLETPASGSVLTLSAIQLFDLAAVLDEYATEHATTIDRPNVLSRNSVYNRGDRAADIASVESSSRLPNLPGVTAQPLERPAYYPIRAPRKSSSFMSGIPWAIAAAVAVGLPLLLLDPNSNPVKDLATKLNIPNLAGTKKATTAKTPKNPATTTEISAPIAGATPTPWQTQPVEPPKTTVKATDSTKVPTTSDPTKIGIAGIPDAILTPSGAVSPTIGSTTGTTTVAPNPLTTNKPTATEPTATKPVAAATTKPATTTKPAATTKPATTTIGQLPIDADTSGKVSISKQPISVPPALSSPVTTPTTPIPFDRAGIDASGKIDPATRSLAGKKADPKIATSSVTTKPKPKTTKPSVATSPNSSEPFTPVLKNPNLIDPNQNSPEPTETKQPAATTTTAPNQPLQSNAGGFGGDPVENASLQETKRYFQSKWKASTTQANALQYVLQVNGKNGVVRAVSPQGEAATTYLQQTKFIKPGQKLLSPAAGGEQKIRVLLQPDGSVDTFIEP
ncbi:DUF4335 domain-containing protein [Chamaesiphon sp. VAR_48_metabat_403]|uniref:DUF4335 domain-containing protein n=1 Tax=Chamaesiphon sp. VAR_48_metabat_403 TaxID=2964700 RepID=UPI00286DBB17|nr:DUF4335 domain-containing protein [Chamaesiphon sp. VAR_48_metabat_403]